MKTRRELALIAYSWFSGFTSGIMALLLVEVICKGTGL